MAIGEIRSGVREGSARPAPSTAGNRSLIMASTDIGLDLSRYKLGWSDAEDYVFKPKKGLSTDIINEMSWMKGEPKWMLDERLKSYQHFQRRPMPTWGGDMSEIYFDDIYYYIKPTGGQVDEWDDLPDAIKLTYE